MTGRALVTGATGMLGSYIVERLREDGWSVRALVRSRDRVMWLEGIGAELADGLLEDVDSLTAAANSCDAVFHAAAAIGPGGDWEEYRRGNVEGTRNVVEAAARASARPVIGPPPVPACSVRRTRSRSRPISTGRRRVLRR